MMVPFEVLILRHRVHLLYVLELKLQKVPSFAMHQKLTEF